MYISQIIKILLLIICGIVFYFLFLPKSYDVLPFEEREGTQYWQLKTGSRIGYTKIESQSSEKKSPIIYLHGGPGGRVKNVEIETLAPLSALGHDLYFYDQIGSGHSDRLKDIKEYTVKRHKEDLEAIVELIGNQKVIIIGQSWGSLLAINFLQDHSDKVERMILTGPGPILPINSSLKKVKSPDSLQLQAPKFSNKEGNQKAYTARSKLIMKWAQLFGKKLAKDKEVDDFFTYLNEELSKSTTCDGTGINRYTGGAGYYTHIMTVKSFYEVPNQKEKLKTITTPILLIKGQCDNQAWGYTKEYLELLPHSRLEIIKNTGHNLFSGDRAHYYQLVKHFLD